MCINSKRAYVITNNDGSRKPYTTYEWNCRGTHITIPNNSFAVLYGRIKWLNGKPNGIVIVSNPNDIFNTVVSGVSHGIETDISSIGEYDKMMSLVLYTSAIVEPGTYYLCSCLDRNWKDPVGSGFVSEEELTAIIFTY